MNPVVIFQLGDVHLPDAKVDALAVDIKDSSAPSHLVSAIRPDRLRNTMQALLKVIESRRNEIRGMLICGDLTSRGQLDGYKDCVNYLDKCLQLTDSEKWRQSQIHVVPGNHDVNRDNCEPTGSDLFLKFKPLESEWSQRNIPILATRSVRNTTISDSPNSVSVFSMNSCMGCGERRYLPTTIRDDLVSLLESYVDCAQASEAFELVGETLDTPAFIENDVTHLVDSILDLRNSCLPIVLAHHNLLPQALVRVEIYTEVVNGGLLRSRLAQCGRPILYCHGHIHTDPVEVITDPQSNGRLISISSPQLIDGFNIIEIHFSRSQTPIGCQVIPYRTANDHGGVQKGSPIRVPLQDVRHARLYEDPITQGVADSIGDSFMRFSELKKLVLSRTGQKRINDKTLASAINDLAWLDLVDVYNHEEEPRVWDVRSSHS